MVSAAGSPWVFALDTASGPVSPSSASASGSSGIRSATVPQVSPRSQSSMGCAWQITVSGPGQNCDTSAMIRSSVPLTRASSVSWPWTRTGGGMSRPRPLAASSAPTARALKASAAIP